MASVETKLFTRIVLRVAVFISLSVLISADGSRCYWCGPLAEQVHRSQRAPPCGDTNTHVTVCDPGFPHCAIVATSPPYVESRYCVKFYQDECYSLYCNSTKTWRMICPCRGDLCNGPNTEREHGAFAVLVKLVAKNARIKRSLMLSPGFISIRKKNEMKNTTADEIETESDIEAIDIITIAEDVTTQSNSNEINEHSNQAAQNPTNDEMQSDQPVDNIDAANSESEMTTNPNELSKSTTENMINGLNDNINETKTNLQTTPENKDTVPTEPTELSKDIIKLADKVKTSNTLPTADVRQHDKTPAGKINDQTMNPTMMNTRNNDLSTKVSMRANNTATKIDTHLITLAIGIILQY